MLIHTHAYLGGNGNYGMYQDEMQEQIEQVYEIVAEIESAYARQLSQERNMLCAVH